MSQQQTAVYVRGGQHFLATFLARAVTSCLVAGKTKCPTKYKTLYFRSDYSVKMGLVGVLESGNGNGVGSKSAYTRMDSEIRNEDGVSPCHPQANTSTNKYVFVCAVFASLNSVLLGYGRFPSFTLFFSVLSCFVLYMFGMA